MPKYCQNMVQISHHGTTRSISDKDSDGNDDESSEYANDDDSDEYDDDDNYESEEDTTNSNQTLLSLCEEGQIDAALERVRRWDEHYPITPNTAATTKTTTTTVKPTATAEATTPTKPSTPEATTCTYTTIHQELYHPNPTTGNYPLHEILTGDGPTTSSNSSELIHRLVLRYTSSSPSSPPHQTVLLAQPPESHGRTVLHWCAWSRTSPEILRMVLGACPEALCRRDDASHGCRTPLEIARRYWPEDFITRILEEGEGWYLVCRVRVWVWLCVERLFGGDRSSSSSSSSSSSGAGAGGSHRLENLKVVTALKPFDQNDRKTAGLKPRPWFVASVLGYVLQREMKGVASIVLSFVGRGARLESRKRVSGGKRRTTTMTTSRDRESNRKRTYGAMERTSRNKKGRGHVKRV